MRMTINREIDGKQYLEFELRLCKMYSDRRHINQTCHNKFEHCWKNARDEKGIENAIAKCIALYPGYEPKVIGVFFE